MIIAAAIPPLWRRIMDRRLLAHYGGEVGRANISPRARARVLRRYGRAEGLASGESAAA
jgi:alkane 1-monooxygenase